MSKDNERFEEFEKALKDLDLGFSDEEIKGMYVEKSEKEDEVGKKEESEEEESYEDMQKSCDKMKADLVSYEKKMLAKKPAKKEVEKSDEEADLVKAEIEDLKKSHKEELDVVKSEMEEKYSKIDELTDLVKSLSESVEKMGDEAPEMKAQHIDYGSVIEKAQGGIEENGITVMSEKVNKDALMKSLEEAWEENQGKEICKAIEVDICNLSNMGGVSDRVKTFLAKEKSIKVV